MALNLVKLMFFTCCIAAISAQAAFYPVWLESLSSEDNGTAITADAMTNRDAMIRAARQLRYNLEVYPQSQYRTWYLVELADALFELGEIDSAISWYQVVEALPDSAQYGGFDSLNSAKTEAWLGLTRCYIQKQKILNAINYLNKILPRNDKDRLTMAELQLKLNRRNTALQLLDETAGVNMPDAASKMRAALLYRQLRRYANAEKLLKNIANDSSTPAEFRSQAQALLKFLPYGTPFKWTNGVFEGKAATRNGELIVNVTIKRDRIDNIVFRGNPLKDQFFACDATARKIVAANHIAVDAIDGAEDACVTVAVAVADALQKARRD